MKLFLQKVISPGQRLPDAWIAFGKHTTHDYYFQLYLPVFIHMCDYDIMTDCYKIGWYQLRLIVAWKPWLVFWDWIWTNKSMETNKVISSITPFNKVLREFIHHGN